MASHSSGAADENLPPEVLDALLDARFRSRDPAVAVEALCRAYPNHAAAIRAQLSGAKTDRDAHRTDAAPDGGADANQVRSTQTAEMLRRLERSPRLDTERYRVEGEIDRGGMGAVLRIHDQQLNRRLAMKVQLEREAPQNDHEQQLAHQLLGRSLEEAQVTSQLDHPGVVPVHELGLDRGGKVYFTMRLVKGRTAQDVFAETHAGSAEWPLTRALEVILKVCDTMAFAHDKGVLHRDLKPSNVMVGRFGEVYVVDWGLAKVLGQADQRDLRIWPEPTYPSDRVDTARHRDGDSDERASVLSMDGQRLGTPCYMSPEQARSEPLDARSDVYAIGAMLYELLSGRPPYTVPETPIDAYRILKAVSAGPPERIESVQSGVPAELVAIAEKGMARDPARRYPSTVELAADLRAFLAQRAVQAHRTGALVELRLWVRRNKPLAASLAVAVLSLLAGIVETTTYAQIADRQALEKAKLAAEVQRKALSLAETVREFEELSGVVQYECAMREEAALYPAWPDKIADIDAWLAATDQLLGKEQQIRNTIALMRESALPASPEAIENSIRAHSRYPEYDALRRRVAAMRSAQEVRSGRLEWVEPELPSWLVDKSPAALGAIAWPLIDWEKAGRNCGQERLALACARRAYGAATTDDERCANGDLLAWALFWCGRDDEALAQAHLNLQSWGGPRAYCERSSAELQRRIDAVRGVHGERNVMLGEQELRELAEALRQWRFGDSEEERAAGFLHQALTAR